MSKLLSPVTIAGLSLENRVVMAPMCMYEVKKEDGMLTPFHCAHYGARAIGKVGLIIVEATAVEPDGRISRNDLGLWNEKQQEAFTQLVGSLHYLGTKVGIQLSHAGRKAQHAAYLVAPSGIEYNPTYGEPNELKKEEINRIQESFVSAAKRAQAAGFDMLEIHGAHGYLVNQFLSPFTNTRTDEYGGSLRNRYLFVQEIITAVREVFKGSLWIRLSLTDYDETGQESSLVDWQTIGQWLERDGVDLLDVSTGGLLDKRPNMPLNDGYQVPFSARLKEAVTIPVATVGLLDNPGLCEYILTTKQADLILQGRALIRNTNWLADAAKVLNDDDFTVYNDSYRRGQK